MITCLADTIDDSIKLHTELLDSTIEINAHIHMYVYMYTYSLVEQQFKLYSKHTR